MIITMYFSNQNTSITANYKGEEKIKVYEDKIVVEMEHLNIIVDSKVELITILHYLMDYEYFLKDNFLYYYLSTLDSNYKKEIEQYFSPYKNHETVLFIEKEYSKFYFYSFIQQIDYALNSTSLPDLHLIQKHSNFLIPTMEDKKFENLTGFDRLLNDFVIDTNFMRFFQEHEDFYLAMIKNTIKYIDDDWISQIEEYYGYKHNSYNLILAPLSFSGGASFWTQSINGLNDTYAVIGPFSSYNNAMPVYNDKSTLSYLIYHEFGHTFINPIAQDYESEILRSYKLYLSMKSEIDGQPYNTWNDVVVEYLVRSVTARLVLHNYGLDEYNKVLQQERELGFIYIDLFVELLEKYENNRSEYTTFNEFFPEIIKALDAQAGLFEIK